MNEVKAISEQYYLSTIFLGALIVFRSSSQQIAVRTIISIAALLIIWQILLFMRAVISAVPIIVISSFTAVAIGTIASEFLSLIPALGMTSAIGILPEQLYLLFCVPVLVFQAEHRIKEVRHRTVKTFLAFSGVLLLFSAVREMLGSGMFFGLRIMPEVFPGMTFFRHASSAAFLLAGAVILFQWIYRRTGKGEISFTNQANDNSSVGVPYLQAALEKSYFRISFRFLGITFLSGAGPVAVLMLAGGSNKMLLYLLPATVITQGVMIGLIYLFTRSLRGPFLDMCLRPYIIPAQTLFLLLPFYILEIKIMSPDRAITFLIFYYLYLFASCFFVGSTMLFIRSVRRKQIFGSRPVFVDGLPLAFVIMGICLIIMSGFESTLAEGIFTLFVT